MDQPPVSQSLEVGLGEREAEGIYSNLVFITHSPSEVILDFARALPGLPKPRVQNPDEQRRLDAARASCALLSERLTALMDRDSESYEAVVAAFRLPKSSDEEKQARSSQIQEALRLATETPLDVMRACRDAIHAAADVAALANSNASSDVQVGLELLMAGLRGAKLNVAINLGSIKDQAYVSSTTQRAAQLEVEGETGRQRAASLLPSSGG